MKQVVQNYRSGELALEDVPAPICRAGSVLVRTAWSLVSTGTELMKVRQARMSLIQKAKARPDKVKQVLQSVRQVGLVETYKKVCERLDALTPLGYSLSGIVEEVGPGIDEFQPGDRVACAGEGIACHAEFVSVPKNLCVTLPEGVELKDAAFGTVGAIVMNGVRQSGVTLGDCVLVVGLGLVGLLAVQVLKAAGCRVIGIDLDPAKLQLARQCGADLAISRDDAALEDTLYHFTAGIGPDAAYVAASTSSSDPLDLAGRVLRDRGTVVIVGMVKVEADWRTYYGKELSVIMSRSYGPGRYDRAYEQKGIDYPVGYVRWTERRNIEEFLRLLGSGQITTAKLLPECFPIERAAETYERLQSENGDGHRPVAVLFEYPATASKERQIALPSRSAGPALPIHGNIGIALIGAGNFATGTLIPALKKIPAARLKAICSAGGLSATSAGKRHGFECCASDYRELLSDPEILAVIIATRHDTHARFAAEALRAGKHVFVEKPLALTHEQLDEVIAAQNESGRMLMVGYNRRFSPLSIAVHDFFADRNSPIEVVCRVNAGALKSDSWYQDGEEGGWRIVSEGCHFIDLICFLCGCAPDRVHTEMVGGNIPGGQNDNCVVTLKMADGSLGTLIYVANGDPSFEKERIEVFGQGRTAVIENWRQALLCANGRVRRIRGGKGHDEEIRSFVDAVAGHAPPAMSFEQIVRTSTAAIAAGQVARSDDGSLHAQASVVRAHHSIDDLDCRK